jgi:hypothetical protein
MQLREMNCYQDVLSFFFFFLRNGFKSKQRGNVPPSQSQLLSHRLHIYSYDFFNLHKVYICGNIYILIKVN